MHFRIAGLEPAPFQPLHALDDAALAARGARRIKVEQAHAAPCRISLDDAAIGENVILLSFPHQPAETPYRQQGPIFVREHAVRFEGGEIAPALRRRPLSLRGYDAAHMMIEADLIEGAHAERVIARFFANAQVAYIHAHYARRGCFAARIDRV
ncbi:MAG TPA: DUF1203 domain-containing protein [Terricaulis sp.]|nr:DUF1203 domain-containing protein [Terricaulis sp.]